MIPKGNKKASAFAVSLVKTLRSKLKNTKGGDEDNVALLSDDDILSSVDEFIPSGFPDLDRKLGGGWPVGRASEVFGQEGAGKSALSQMALKSCQALGGVPVYLDFENALDPDKMEQLGIDPERIVYVSPRDIEEAWDLIWATLDKIEVEQKEGRIDAPTLIVWDSVAASMPRAEGEEKSAAQSHVGLVARAMSKGCRKMFRRISQVRAHMMWINQERDKIGGFSGFGDNKQTTGGAAIRYAASLRVRCVRVQTLKDGASSSGYRIITVTKKNRCAPPHQKSDWILDFTVGPSTELTMLDHFIENRVVKTAKEGEGNFIAPWSKLTFKKGGDWLRVMRDIPGFAESAAAAYNELLPKLAPKKSSDGGADAGEGGEGE